MPDIGKGRTKKLKQRVRAMERLHSDSNHPSPGHAAATAANDEACKPDVDKNTANPVPHVNSPTGSYDDSRISAPITAGHAAYSTGDHGVGQGRNNALAAGHPDLRQSNTSLGNVLATLHTERGDRTAAEIGIAGFAYQGNATVHSFDARGQAGSYTGMQPVNPSPARPAGHPARSSATPANGSIPQGQQASQTIPRQSMKGSEAIALMKQTMREQGIGA